MRMSKNTAVTLTYVVAVGCALIAADRPLVGFLATLPFVVLLVAARVRSEGSKGRSLATTGLILLALSPMIAPVGCIAGASIAFTGAFLRRETRTQRRVVMWLFVAGAVICAAMLAALVVRHGSILAWLGGAAFFELALATLVAVASTASLGAGVGAFAMLLGENAWLLSGFKIGVGPVVAGLLWYLGTLLVTRPWTATPDPVTS
jgi:hypothetical protein